MRALVLSVLLLTLAIPAAGQTIGDYRRVDCGKLDGSQSVDSALSIVCGLTADQVGSLVGLAISPQATDQATLRRRLDDLLPATTQLSSTTVQSLFGSLAEAGVPPAQLRNRFAEIAQRHLDLLDELERTRGDDGPVQDLREAAAAALRANPANQDLALVRLDDARRLLRARHKDADREEAALMRAQAGIEETRLRFAAAARFYEEAADRLPNEDADARWLNLLLAGHRYQDDNRIVGDQSVFEDAIAAYRGALDVRPRAAEPTDWAMTQHSVGAALATLGTHERGTTKLEEAAAAFRAALTVYTRDRHPLRWAQTQNNLGRTLTTLGLRERSTERLEEAVAALQATLTERTRERAPLAWAETSNNLGDALLALGVRSFGSIKLREAIAAYRAALLEYDRSRFPLKWAMVHNNLGLALSHLGRRPNNAVKLESAIAAFRAALTERTRTRAPHDWAETQTNLGVALSRLGQLENGIAKLEEALAAFRAARTEHTRKRAPLDWARTRMGEGRTLLLIAARKRSLEDVVAAEAALHDAWSIYAAARPKHDEWFRAKINEARALSAALGAKEI